MRIRVHLHAPPPIVIPLNYAHQLASVIYRLLDRSSPAYASFLHGQGYGTGDRRFNLFTFSPLFGHPRQVVAGHLQFQTSAISWSITSPVEAFIRHVVQGMLSPDRLEIAHVPFTVAQVKALRERFSIISVPSKTPCMPVVAPWSSAIPSNGPRKCIRFSTMMR